MFFIVSSFLWPDVFTAYQWHFLPHPFGNRCIYCSFLLVARCMYCFPMAFLPHLFGGQVYLLFHLSDGQMFYCFPMAFPASPFGGQMYLLFLPSGGQMYLLLPGGHSCLTHLEARCIYCFFLMVARCMNCFPTTFPASPIWWPD